MESLNNIINNKKEILIDFLGDPVFFEITNPSFLEKSSGEQKALCDKIPKLKELGIESEDIKASLEEYCNLEKNLKKENLDRKVSYFIDCIVESQEKSGEDGGGWKKIELKQERVSYNISPSNAWNNSVLTMSLIKWEKIKKSKSKKLEEAIEKGIDWLNNHKIREGNYFGWAGMTGRNNIYDTSFAITTIINFEETFKKKIGKVPIETLLDDNSDYFLKKEKLWIPEIGQEPDIGSSSYALLALMHYYNKKGYYNYPRIVEGIQGLIENSLNGSWGKGSKEKYNRPWVDRTCYALQTLIKYSLDTSVNENDKIIIENKVKKGIEFLESQLKLNSEENYKFWSWLDDRTSSFSIRNSALAISTLLKCKVPYYNSTIETGLFGLFKLLEIKKVPAENKNFFPDNEFPYFVCTLADYLKEKL